MMKFIILFVTVCALVASATSEETPKDKHEEANHTPPEDYEAHIESTDFKINDEGGFKFGYSTSNKIKIEEESDGQNIVEGSYSYVDPDGRTHTVTYIAGAGIGFQPTGDDIHPEVAAGIELNLKNPPQETTTLKQ